ncbi:Lrp/AsnC ligand binding domain-containing protein [Candidatus Woesearchaeota archaeon]|nr:Lrp/AsnC ligand binding domain-containing protein [Candidatus Woesearchaeota archaeon]MBW3017314.1 Lrp/AsnC ligand binding domain-containing protein [Candidatus Woesearchaeota archaeon]
MKKKYIVLLSCLRNNSRMKLKRMSQLTKIPVTTIHDQLKNFPEVHKFSALLNFDQLGYFARASLAVSVEPEDRERLGSFLQNTYEVNSLYRINNGYDFLAELVFKKIKDAEQFVARLENEFKIKKKEVHYILDDVKRESFMSSPELVNFLETQQSS